VNFTIVPANLSAATVTLVGGTAFPYTGSPITPAIATVTLGGVTLTAGADYTVTGYANNTAVGVNTASVTLGPGTGGNYTGSKVVNFTISAGALTGATVTVTGGPFTYTGSQIQPTVTVMVGGVTLTPGTDYAITGYANNTNAGTNTASLTIGPGTGGTYAGTQTVNFTIAKAAPTLALAANPPAGLAALPGTVTLTATLAGPDVAGKTITFTANGAPLGTATTNAAGVATTTYTPPATGNYSLGASFASDANNLAAQAAAISAYPVGLPLTTTNATAVPTLNEWALALLALLLTGLAARRRRG